MKILKRSILIVLILAIGYGFYYMYQRLPIITGYAAKDMCSCVFIGNRDASDVTANEFQFSLVKYADTEIDYDKKTVTASVWGMGDKTAYYHPQKGCAVVAKEDAEAFLKPVENLTQEILVKEIPLEFDSLNASVDYKKLQDAVSHHFEDLDPEKPYGTRAVLVLKNGKLIAEQYAAGFDVSSKHIGWSMTKSIFNALIGIAIRQDYISGVEENELFKEWKSDERKNVTLKQLLQMNSGLEWTEDYGDISEATVMLYDEKDMIKYAKERPLEQSGLWEYSSGSSNLLSGLLRQRFKDYESYFRFPYEQLFDKIGASSFTIETDACGNFVASSYAWATARDWAKFGLLFLNKGVSPNSEQLFPEDWTQFTSGMAEGSNGSYGAQFWLPTATEYPNAPAGMYFADGFQGQRIFIIPSHGLVIVRLGLTRFDQPNYDVLISEIIASLK